MESTGAVLGIDVGYSKKQKTTGLCLLKWEGSRVELTLENIATEEGERRAAIRSILREVPKLAAVAIDGPLARGLEPINCYRVADALLSRGIFQKRGKPGQTNSDTGQRLNDQAIKLAKLVKERDVPIADAVHPDPVDETTIVEAFPTAFLAAMLPEAELEAALAGVEGPRRRKKSDIYWRQLTGAEGGGTAHDRISDLLSLLVTGGPTVDLRFERRLWRRGRLQTHCGTKLAEIKDHEEAAAFTCALTALAVATNNAVAVGAPEQGDIFLPPPERWGRCRENEEAWCKNGLRENLKSLADDVDFPNPRVRVRGEKWDCDGQPARA
jgi:hypothetical protein